MYLAASLFRVNPTIELYWSIQMIHSPPPCSALPPDPPAQIPPSTVANTTEPPPPTLSPLTAVALQMPSGHRLSFPAARGTSIP